MGLATYNSCSVNEKRAVLRTFWSGRMHASEKINQAAHEYGPYAFWFVSIITFELFVIAALLVLRANGWAWVATAATVLALWSLWWTLQCRRRLSLPLHAL
jgi:Flp pilus assembly protein TadB